jgi:hypothetical protein
LEEKEKERRDRIINALQNYDWQATRIITYAGPRGNGGDKAARGGPRGAAREAVAATADGQTRVALSQVKQERENRDGRKKLANCSKPLTDYSYEPRVPSNAKLGLHEGERKRKKRENVRYLSY